MIKEQVVITDRTDAIKEQVVIIDRRSFKAKRKSRKNLSSPSPWELESVTTQDTMNFYFSGEKQDRNDGFLNRPGVNIRSVERQASG